MRYFLVPLLVAILAPAALPDDKPKKDTAIEPTSWGRVIGQVYDAKTGAPIEGATVSIQTDGEFQSSGRTVGATDAAGRYRPEAMLGRVSSNLDIGRVLGSGVFGLIMGSATNTTKRIDVTRLNMRVVRDGYKPFEGVVVCHSANAEKFSVTMEPILLAAAPGPEVSTVAEGWGIVRVTGVTIEPATPRPGTKARVTATVSTPRVLKQRDLKMKCFYTVNGKSQLRDMKALPDPSGDTLTYTMDIDVPGNSKAEASELIAVLWDSPYDIMRGAGTSSALLQVVTNEARDRAAAVRADAYRSIAAEEYVPAVEKLKTLCALPDADVWDYRRLAAAAEQIHDNATAIAALKRATELTPEKPEDARIAQIARYANALVAGGEGQKVLSDYAPIVESVKEKDRPKKVPLQLMVALGKSYVQANRLTEAEAISQELLKWDGAGRYSGTAEFRNSLRLAQAEARLKSEPASAPARADYARVLMDLGRWEEASDSLRQSLKTDPDQPAVRRDLSYALLHVSGREEEASQDLDAALAAAEQQVQVTDKGKPAKSKDFFAWHKLGVLLYARGRRQEAQADASAGATLTRCQEAMKEALRCGRKGAVVDPGLGAPVFGWLSGSLVAVTGFAYPEANNDFVILDSLKTLTNHPDDYLAHLNLGIALLDLGQVETAAAPIQRARQLKPECVEANYAAAILAFRKGDRDAATAGLKNVLAANPLHGRANLALAKIYTEDGDMPVASACLAAHARVYGSAKRSE